MLEKGSVARDEGRRGTPPTSAPATPSGRSRSWSTTGERRLGRREDDTVTAFVMPARDFETMAGVMPHVAEQIHAAIRERMQN